MTIRPLPRLTGKDPGTRLFQFRADTILNRNPMDKTLRYPSCLLTPLVSNEAEYCICIRV
jgi:hypothetical protein